MKKNLFLQIKRDFSKIFYVKVWNLALLRALIFMLDLSDTESFDLLVWKTGGAANFTIW